MGEEALLFYGADDVEAFCDNNPMRQGRWWCKKRVMNLDELTVCHQDYRVVIAVGAAEAIWEISRQLKILGYSAFILH